MYLRITWFGILLFFILAGCARLPEYARPKFHQAHENILIDDQSFGYRKLTIADFQAASLPGDNRGYHHNIQARSCISIRPTPDTSIRIANSYMDGKQVYFGSYNQIAFQAVFNPSCSWWNPSVPENRRKYVLEHEQVHFALTELSARKLDEQYREGLLEYLAVGRSFQEVQNELLELAKSVAHEELEKELEAHTAFDEQTSLYYNQKAQQKWYDKVKKRLLYKW